MDLRGFPQVNNAIPEINFSLDSISKMTSLSETRSCSMLDNMMLSELMTRNYVGKYKRPNLFSMHSVISKCCELMQNNNIGLNEFLESVDLSISDENGLTLLKVATSQSNVDAVKVILKLISYTLNDIDLNILTYVCEQPNYNTDSEIIINELLKCSNIDVNKIGGYQKETPLYYVILHDNNMNIIKLLLTADKINVNSKTNTGQSLLHYAITNRRDNAAMMLLDNKSIVFGKEDLDCIFGGSSKTIINYLLNVKKFKVPNDEYFIQLIKRNDIPIELCKCYNNINFQDIHGKTALMYATEMNYIDKVEFLLTNPNIDLSVVDNSNMNSLLFATTNKNYVCVKSLLEHEKINKEIVNQKNESWETSLIIAIKNNDNATFKSLYKSQLCDLNIVDTYHNSALYYCIDNNNTEMFNCLCNDINVDVNSRDLTGNTPIYRAIDKSAYDMIYKLFASNRLDFAIVNNYNQNVLAYILDKKYNGRSIDDTKLSSPDCGAYASYPNCYNLTVENKYSALVNERMSDSMMTRGNLISSLMGNKIDSSDMDDKLIKFLIKKQVELNDFDVYDKSIFTQVIDHQDKLIFNALLRSEKLDINAQNNQGETYLIYLFKKIDGSETSSQTNYNPINKVSDWHMSSIQPEINFSQEMTGSYFKPTESELSKSIIKPRPMSIPKFNKTPTITKLDSKQTTYLTFFMQLLEHPNVNINATDYTNSTLLSYVVGYNNMNLLSKVLKHKDIDVNVQDNDGVTPFIKTISRNLWNNAKLLLSCGCNPDIVDNEGRSAKNYLDNASLEIYNRLFGQSNDEKSDQDNKNQSNTNKRWFF